MSRSEAALAVTGGLLGGVGALALLVYAPAAFGNDRQLWSDASPTLRLTRAPVPMLLVCSSRRADSCAQARGFADKATSLGGRVSVFPIDLRHGEINTDLGAGGDLTAQVDNFLHSLHLP